MMAIEQNGIIRPFVSMRSRKVNIININRINNIILVNYKKAFFILLIILVILVSLDLFFYISTTIPSSTEELCYNFSWNWNDYIKCIENIN